MWKINYVVYLILIASIVFGQNSTLNTTNSVIPIKKAINKKEQGIITQEISKIPTQNNSNPQVKQNDSLGNDSEKEPKEPTGDLDTDEFNFKYYWIILVASSFAMLGIITYKSLR